MKKGINNLLSGLVGQIITIVLGIIIPRLVLKNLGSEVNGLTSSINQVLKYLALLEAGVGTATLQALYKPIALDDKNRINGIISATHYYYQKTGLVYFFAICGVSFIYSFVVKTTLPRLLVFATVLLSGMPGVVNYFFQSKYRLLLQAEGKSYVLTNLTTITTILVDFTRIILLNLGFGIISIQTAYLVYNLVQMLFIEYYIKKNYAWLNVNSIPDHKAINQKNAVLVHQLSSLIFGNTDMLVLSVFCGLKVVSVYSMYVLLFGMIGTAIATFNGSIVFRMGQLYNSKDSRFIQFYDAFELLNMSLTFALYTIANIFVLGFLRLYTSGVSDIDYIDNYLPYLFIATYLLSNGRAASSHLINFAGHFKNTTKQAIIESVINITVSIVAVMHFGIYGVLIGTIVALLYRTNDMVLYAAHRILNRSAKKTYIKWIVNCALFLFISHYGIIKASSLGTYLQIIVWAGICCIIIIPLFVFIDFGLEIETANFIIVYLKGFIFKSK